MRVLITGATGYVGRHVVDQLRALPSTQIATLNRDCTKAVALFGSNGILHASIDDLHATIKEFDPEVVLHLATLSTSSDSPEIAPRLIETNIAFGVRLLDALRNAPSLKLFVNTGSFAEYRLGIDRGFCPAYLYTASKSAFRHFVDYYADTLQFATITLVPYTVYGGRDTAKKLIDYMMDAIDAAEPVKMSPGEQILDFVHVHDVARAFCSAVEHADALRANHDRATFHIGTSRGSSPRQIAQLIEQIVGRMPNIEWGGRAYRPLDVMHAVAPERHIAALNWEAQITIEQGIKQKIENRKNEKI